MDRVGSRATAWESQFVTPPKAGSRNAKGPNARAYVTQGKDTELRDSRSFGGPMSLLRSHNTKDIHRNAVTTFEAT